MANIMLKLVIQTVSYTPGLGPVHIHYAGVPGTTGPFAITHICHTTQDALSLRSGQPGYWSDVELRDELRAHLAEHGLEVEVIDARTTRPAKRILAKMGPPLDKPAA
jgi:hypothetical protein